MASKGVPTNVASSATSVELATAHKRRAGVAVYNDSTKILYLLLGDGTASATNYTVQMASGDYFETPFKYEGAVQGIWESANGYARVTELF